MTIKTRAAALTAALAAGLALAIAPSPTFARKAPPPAWQVLRATDPVTQASTCTVVASDYVGKTRFTQVGGLYPVVEMNSTYGLLVGVSSGGRIRMPTGDIVWLVDEHPYRELHAAENPGMTPPPRTGADASANLAALTAWSMQMARGGVATSTLASGAKAREMLDEMLQGHSLLFHAAAGGQQVGLPNYSALMAGQVNAKGELHPVPLDASFHEGLKACGIE